MKMIGTFLYLGLYNLEKMKLTKEKRQRLYR